MSAPPGFDVKQANVVAQWPYDRPLNACRFDPTGKLVFCGAEDANLVRFDVADGKHVPTFPAATTRGFWPSASRRMALR